MNTKRGTITLVAMTLVSVLLIASSRADERGPTTSTATYARMGHSEHGEAFDEGPRQRPWKMEGIGKTHFPVTTSVPEVQEWFDQGHTLLHSFWFPEAERAFRWCLKLDPECAMAYWGLYRCAQYDEKRAAAFLREASKRKDKVSDRERMYIEAWEARTTVVSPLHYTPEMAEAQKPFLRKLEQIMLKYPDDLEAKAIYAHANLFSYATGSDSAGNRYGNEQILQEILRIQRDHPGAHHYRIHNWDGPDAVAALDSLAAFPRIVTSIAHAPHMAGHGYSAAGMWHEAAFNQQISLRVGRQYMRQRMIFPFSHWAYGHDVSYLCNSFEQLGMVEAAIDGARQLLAAPLDPDYNRHDTANPLMGSVFDQGLTALIRALVKFERWKEILEPGSIPFDDKIAAHQAQKAYVEALAHFGLGNLAAADERLAELQKLATNASQKEATRGSFYYGLVIPEIEGLLALARGNDLEGLRLLTEAAEQELKVREKFNDPPTNPRVLYNVVGEAYLKMKTPGLAVQAFEKALDAVRNDPFALSGLAQAHFALGEKDKAAEYYGRLLFVWSDADPGLRWMESAKALGLTAEPKDVSPAPQRNYRKTNLDHLGPAAWEPYDSPELKALDAEGKTVALEEYRGKNLLLVFYLGEECPHCMKQLVAIKERISDFQLNNTQVAAISSASPDRVAASEKLSSLSIRLLSDTNHENAKRFHSYDEFEEIELHSTILIDSRGKVHWARTGGDAFMDLDFLVGEIKRINAADSTLAQATDRK